MIPPPRPAPPWPDGCFWSGYAQPDIRHCEENLCGAIAAPADTWSNLAYFAVAAWLLSRESRSSRLLGWCVAFIGLSSFVFHASYTFLFQVFDYAGMFTLIWLHIGLCRERLGKPVSLPVLIAAGTVLSTAVLLLAHRGGLPLQPVFAAHVGGLLLYEGLAFRRETDYRWLGAAVGLAALGFLCWMLDYTRVWCDPADHLFQAHAVWHLITALSFVALARFYQGILKSS